MCPQSLSPIPLNTKITDPQGRITAFFRLRYQQLIDSFTLTPTLARADALTGLNAAIGSTAIATAKAAGTYRISYYYRRTTIDGVASSLTFTWGWTESGLALTENAAANTSDSVLTGEQSGSKVVDADANTNLTYSVAYGSTTPGQMKYRIRVVCEQLA